MQDLLGRGQSLVACHVLRCCTEVPGRQSGRFPWGEIVRSDLGAELEVDGRIVAYLADRAPEGEQLLRRDEDAGLIEEVLGSPALRGPQTQGLPTLPTSREDCLESESA